MHFLVSLQKCFQRTSLHNFRKPLVAVTNCTAISSTHLLKSQLLVSSQVRTFWESFPYTRPLFFEKDGLSRSKYELVYHSRIFNYAFYAQLVSLCALSSQCLASVYYACKSYMAQEVVHIATNIGPFVVNYDLQTILIIGLFTIQNCLMFVSAQTACFRVYHCEESDKYVFISLAINPFKSRLSYCNPGEVMPLKSSLFNVLFGNHDINGKRFFLRFDLFKTTAIYNKLVGDNCE